MAFGESSATPEDANGCSRTQKGSGAGSPTSTTSLADGRRPSIPLSSTQPPGTPESSSSEKVTWSSLPHKTQLLILTLARLSEPLTQTSLQAYLYHQLASFSPTLSPSAIATQAGLVQASFSAAQALTAMLWGRLADSPRVGRKVVIVVGLCGTCVGSVGYGFAGGWKTAVAWRVLSGMLNGNMGVMRTMISEIVRDKKYQSRAFLLLPMCFNIGVIIGPVLGGFLADPVISLPSLFGSNSLFGGSDGVWWMRRWPYALPNILSAIFLFGSAMCVILGLRETHEALRGRPDLGLRLGRILAFLLQRLLRPFRLFRRHKYRLVASSPDLELADLSSVLSTPTPLSPLFAPKSTNRPVARRLPFLRIWTPNVLTTLLSHFLLSMGVGTFGTLYYIFLSSPRSSGPVQLPFWFTGGLGLTSSSVGLAMAILGSIGILLQLLVYPAVSAKLGTLRSYRFALALFPIVYLLTPYLSLLPSSGGPEAPASGPLVWISLAALLGLYVVARTFALPANVILVNNCSPNPTVLGTVHGMAQSLSGVARTVGPVGGGWVFGRGEAIGLVGLAYWVLVVVSLMGWGVSLGVWEGDGHELLLDGEAKDDENELGRLPANGAALDGNESVEDVGRPTNRVTVEAAEQRHSGG